MTITGYLKIPDTAGDSTRAEPKDQIDINGVQWGVRQRRASGARRARRMADADTLTVMKFYDAASPYLALAKLRGQSFDEMVFYARKDSGNAHSDYLRITMTNCAIADYEMFNNGPTDPLVQICEKAMIGFEKINIVYVQQVDDHFAGDEHEIEFDVTAGV